MDRTAVQVPPSYQESPGRKLVVDALFQGDNKAGALSLGEYLSTTVSRAAHFREGPKLL